MKQLAWNMQQEMWVMLWVRQTEWKANMRKPLDGQTLTETSRKVAAKVMSGPNMDCTHKRM